MGIKTKAEVEQERSRKDVRRNPWGKGLYDN